MIFVSHAWEHDEHYWKVVGWFNDANNFDWKNCSVPSHDSLPDKSVAGLKTGLARQISPAQVVVLLGGMYAAHSDWIDYEIKEAKRMNKAIVGVRPWGQQRVPVSIQSAATTMVNWNSASVVQAVRDLS